jgi:streptogramin lyase
MRSALLPVLIALFTIYSAAQTPVGTWTDRMYYNTALDVTAGNGEVFASTGNSILVYNAGQDELRKLSAVNGLSETGISTLGWSDEQKTLIIAYNSSNIDLVKENTIYNIPDISLKYIPGKKEINRIRTKGRYAYLAAGFGIVVIDLVRREIYDTWKPGLTSEANEVWDLAIKDNIILAASSTGIFRAELSNQGLAYYASWTRIKDFPGFAGRFTSILASGNRIYVNKSPLKSVCDTVYINDGTTRIFTFTPGIVNRAFDYTESGFGISWGTGARFFNSDGSELHTVSSYAWGSPDIWQTCSLNGSFYIADKRYGLVKRDQEGILTTFKVAGPVSNNSININSFNGRTIICGGGVSSTWNILGRPFEVSVHDNGSWKEVPSVNSSDALRSAIDPADKEHFFISTWGGGLFEFNGNTVKNYNASNSPLQTIIPNAPYVRICGLAFDKNRNLWITQTEVPGSIKVLKPDGTWIVNPLTLEATTLGDIMIDRNNRKWIVLPRGNGLLLLDDNGTPEYPGDDRSKTMFVIDSENNIISIVNCIAEDLDGNIWVGTDQGPLVYYNPSRVFDEDLKAYRIKVPRNDGSGIADYMLKTESITAIEVDGANRKWVGTGSSGAFLLTPDGTRKVRNYNKNNSPLPSDAVLSIAVDDRTGEIWFGTQKGVVSIRGDATEGSAKFENVYAFPNPVREDYSGNLTITGLMKDTQVRITDISGNLVFRTVSDGGSATWDLTTYKGLRVTTGVYLAFCASSDGSEAEVIKILVIR